MSEFLTALFLGLLEGLTEFLPVSSTAHLVVFAEGLNFPAPPGHVFEVFIQLGAILAIIVLYWKKLWGTVITLPASRVSQSFALNIIVATIPAVIVGFLGRVWIKDHLYNHYAIAVALIFGGVLILVIEKLISHSKPKVSDVDGISVKTALLVGVCQMLALVPGVSRSGATMMGGLVFGLSRPVAAEFSFFMAIPVMLGAVAYDTYKSWEAIIAHDHLGLMLTGLLTAFLSALVIIRPAVDFISRYGFSVFGWYRIAAGLLVLIVFS